MPQDRPGSGPGGHRRASRCGLWDGPGEPRAYPDRYRDANRHVHRNAYCNANRHCNRHRHVHRHAKPYSHQVADADPHPHRHGDAVTDSNGLALARQHPSGRHPSRKRGKDLHSG